MKKRLLSLTIVPLLLLGACSSAAEQGPKEYTINFFMDDRSTLLYTTKVEENTMPVYQGVYPTKQKTEQYTYRFNGWDPVLAKATKNENYYAVFEGVLNTYNVKIGETEYSNISYGSHLEEPERPEDVLSDDKTTIDIFDGWYIEGTDIKWNFETDVVTGDVVLVARFITVAAYKVTFLNEGAVFFEDYFGDGQVPSYRGEATPTKEPEVKFEYDFTGWSPEFSVIHAAATYNAVYKKVARKYLISFVNYDNRVLYSARFEVDTMPVYQGETPTKPSDAVYKYAFKGWDKEIVPVEGEATYVATYNASFVNAVLVTINQYVDNNPNPVFTDSFEAQKNTKYLVADEYRELKASGYNPNQYALASSDIIDVYIIAGQSNASGYSMINNISSETIKNNYPASTSVLYYGVADYAKVENFNTYVDFGLGAAYDRFGAEVGMAKAIQTFNTSNPSIILKTAFGGSYLVDNHTDSPSINFGNWCSPSERNPSTAVDGITGVCYDKLLENIDTVVNHYHEEGYTVRLGGTFWMQGEAESGTATSGQYGNSLEALIKDLRNDYATRFDDNAATAEFVIGKIAPDFAGGHEGVDNVRSEQVRIANKLENVTALESYNICENGQPKTGCIDKYHFASDDMLDFGNRIGSLMTEKLAESSEIAVKNRMVYNLNDDTTINIYFDKKAATSYSIEYHLKGNDGLFHTNSYKKVVTKHDNGDDILSNDYVEITNFDLPTELAELPAKGLADGWNIDKNQSYYKGLVVKGNKTLFVLYYELSFSAKYAHNMVRSENRFVCTQYSAYNELGAYYMLGTYSNSAYIKVQVPNNLIAFDALNHSYGGICYTDGSLGPNNTPKTADYGICESGLVFACYCTGGYYSRSPLVGDVSAFYYDKVNHSADLGGSSRELTLALHDGMIYCLIEGKLVYSVNAHNTVVPAFSFDASVENFMFGIYLTRSVQANMSILLLEEKYGEEASNAFETNVMKNVTVRQSLKGEVIDGTTQNYKVVVGSSFTVPDSFLTLPDQGDGKHYVFDGMVQTTQTINEDTTITINFIEANKTSYTILYYYQMQDGTYQKCSYEKLVENVYAGVHVIADTTEPGEITRPLEDSVSGGYIVDETNSTLEGTVATDGSLVLKIYYKMVYTYIKDVKRNGDVFTNQSLPVYQQDVGNFYTLGSSKTAVVSVLIKKEYMDRPGCTNTCGISVMKGVYGSSGWNSTDFSLSNVGLRSNNSLTSNRGRESSHLDAYYNADHSLMNDADRTLTIVLYESKFYIYIDAKLVKTYSTSLTEPLCGYTADSELTFAVYFANNAPTGKLVTLKVAKFGNDALSYISDNYSGDIVING